LINVNFYPKNAKKCQVSLQLSKIKTAEEIEGYKLDWKERLERLASLIS
jgi:hypothetical protein